MTCRELYLQARQRLQQAGVDSPGVDTALLAERFLGLDRRGLALHGEEEAPSSKAQAFLAALHERENRRPLQYILGEWEFMGLSLTLGEGVLVPREDTVVLVETLAKGLAFADFHPDYASRPHQGQPQFCDSPVKHQTVLASIQGQGRFVSHLRRQG